MTKFLVFPLSLALLAWGTFLPVRADAPAPAGGPSTPTFHFKVPLHPEWFSARYDEVRDLTRFQTKSDFGPGNAPSCTHGDRVLLDLSAAMEGKSFGPHTRFTAMLYFNRMAGLAREGNGPILAGKDKRFQPFDSSSGKLLAFEDSDQVYFLTPSGKRFSLGGDDVEHKTETSTGILGEVYLWETVIVSLDWDQLNELKDGARVAIGDREMEFSGDNISMVRTLIFLVQGAEP